MSEPLLEIKNLTKSFFFKEGFFFKSVHELQAVKEVDLTISKGKTLGLVGESGCGKSTLGLCLVRLLKPTSGSILFESSNIAAAQGKDLLRLRRDIQMIFQDPYESLNPRMTIEDALVEPYQIHQPELTRTQILGEIKALLEVCGLSVQTLKKYPHEFSGGQRQRICIARALSVKPKFIVCDEAVSALDVSIQAQIINLLMDLQKQFDLTYLFISHDLSVVRHICDDVAVMYLGRVVEQAPTDALFRRPCHPYTQALLSAAPFTDLKRDTKGRIELQGDVPSPIQPPSGCAFHPRCWKVTEECRRVIPRLERLEEQHDAACFHPDLK
ncbi:MAG: hypothetical protein CMJ43_18550 [Phyllobacteriaceae bacterium]|nr:hypothetical protein [Phyllobacteriaceae bacterium]